MQTHLKLDEVIDALSLLVIESEPETVVELLGTPVTDAEADEVMLVPGREIEGREMGRERDRGSVADADELGGADVMDSEPLTEEDVIEAGNESVVDDGGLRIEESTDDRGSTLELVDDAESVMVAETESVAVVESRERVGSLPRRSSNSTTRASHHVTHASSRASRCARTRLHKLTLDA